MSRYERSSITRSRRSSRSPSGSEESAWRAVSDSDSLSSTASRLPSGTSRRGRPSRQRAASSAEPTSAQPRPREDFGCQIGRMFANPCPRPPKHLADVPVVHLRERIGIARSEEFGVRRPGEVASHNLYFATPQEVCHPVAVCGNHDKKPRFLSGVGSFGASPLAARRGKRALATREWAVGAGLCPRRSGGER
jgi:hypothetical protein